MWRGPEQNGISRETGLVGDWSPDGKNVLWKSKELGTRSTPIIMRGKLYTLTRSEPDTPREGERVVCADAQTGKVLWENKFNVFLSDVPAERVAWSCVVGDPTTRRVFAMGVCGYFQCLDGDTGETIWSRSLNEEFGLLSTYGGRTNVPVLFEDLVITSAVIIGWGDMARPAHRFLAFNKHTGEVVWFNGTKPLPEETTYSTPVLTTLGGQAAMVFGSGDGSVWAFQPRTGLPLWNYKVTTRGVNVPPLVVGDKVYIGQSEENPDDSSMGAVACINGVAAAGGQDITQSGEIWRKKEVMVGRAGMVEVGDRIYSVDDSGNMYIFDAKSGELIGKRTKLLGTIMRASLLYADGKIYAFTTSAWHVLEPTDKGVKIVARGRLPEGEEIHGSPIVSHGKLYVPTTEFMYCLGTPDAQTGVTPAPVLAAEAPIGGNTRPAHVQLIPAEMLIKPGEKISFRAQLFNDRGQLLEERAEGVTYTLTGPGQIDAAGNYTADSVPSHTAVIVRGTLGEATGQARVRIVPPLPWKFDFSDGEVPLPWLGMRYRHLVREVEGEKVMVKITTIPKGTKSQGWMGPIGLHDYTIQADFRGAIKNGKLPDMGLIGQRYTLDLMGNGQQLQIRSWASQLGRFSKTVPFSWKPDVWYTSKFRVAVVDGKAVLKGKVWERGTTEPEVWTVEAVDEAPNVQGSPGLFGNANDAEILIDNISVTAN